MTWRLLLVATGLLIALALWRWGRPVAAPPAPPSHARAPATPPDPAGPTPSPTPQGRSETAGPAGGLEGIGELNSPRGDVAADLRLVQAVLEAFRSNFPRDGNPTGSNAEITAALAGRNALGLTLIPPGHPAVNREGELCDRWGTPYFFHSESRLRTEVRSAGPDRRMWTPDDVVLAP